MAIRYTDPVARSMAGHSLVERRIGDVGLLAVAANRLPFGG